MTFTSLASSSRGNCYVVSDGETAILLECGISFRRIKKGLGFDLSAIRACLVSHEHKDHAKSVMDLIKSGVEVFASEGTAEALDCALVDNAESVTPLAQADTQVIRLVVSENDKELRCELQ